ncbi:ribosome assembly RNA-binding protein YhbY [candidate division KSB3 bacterium]|uniref:Ribosome assembly RNA-binding protein YhbY n=1 Tax=candidate division KSB3 bacterium TaxID=2044937 RepID=A0A9D5K0Y4_9BACT|nr:ribosome assembly RNA-binding protein YhbY [candidate division KSB3 bacterium]MBD3327515.1 ribosome assembly RNA-binding protein YhbY [candidate division KSB3 bacterium]
MTTRKGSTRAYLRGLAHHLKPIIFVGQQGITKSFIEAVEHALDAHELIKVRFNSFKDEKKILAQEIAEQTQSELVGMIGHVAILYRAHPDETQRTIQIPEE